MKRFKYIIAGVCLAAAGLTACQKDTDTDKGPDDSGKKKIDVTIQSASTDLTRTIVDHDKEEGTISSNWEEGNCIGIYTTGNNNSKFEIKPGGISGDVATFTGSFSDVSGTIKVYGYHPHNAAAGTNFKAVNANIPAAQVMTRASYDECADYMVALSQDATITGETLAIENYQFRYLVSFLNLTMEIPTVDPNEKTVDLTSNVVNVTLEAPAGTAISGAFTIDLEEGKATHPVAAEGDNKISVAVPANTALSDLSAWIITKPFSITTNDKIIVTITTAKQVITKAIEDKAIDFAEGKAKTLNLVVDSKATVEDFVVPAPSAPAALFINGSASEFGATGKAMRKISDDVFEIYTKLEEGQYGFTDAASSAIKYTLSNGSLVSGSNAISVEAGDAGIYYTKVDFSNHTVTLEKITQVEVEVCTSAQSVPMAYQGNGVWATEAYQPDLKTGWSDDRYFFHMYIDGTLKYRLRSENKDNSAPGSGTSESYYYLNIRTGETDQWDYSYKYPTRDDAKYVTTIYLNPDATAYTHTTTTVDFELTAAAPSTPAADATADLNADGTALEFGWTAGSSSDGLSVRYEVLFYTDDSTTDPLRSFDSGNNGADASASVSYTTLNEIASAANIPSGGDGNIYWAVNTKKGSKNVVSERRKLTITRIQGIESIPEQVYITGAASEYNSSGTYTALRKNGNVFDIVAQLSTTGTYSFTDKNDGTGVKYMGAGIKLYEGDDNMTATTAGIYRITLDFGSSTIKYELITDVCHFMSGNQTSTPMAYMGHGVWEIASYSIAYVDMGGWEDSRYHFRFKIDGNDYKWGSDESGGRELIYGNPADYDVNKELSSSAPEWQWDWGWKFPEAYKGKTAKLRFSTWPERDTRPEDKYTQKYFHATIIVD